MGWPGRSSRFDVVEYKKRKDAVTAVIDFNNAHNVTYRKMALYKYYRISKNTS
jgi:hypothetical protein